MLQETKQYAEKNPEFKNELHDLMEEGIGGKIAEYVQNNSLSPAKTGEIKEVLAGYILEEFVSLLYFTETGYTIEVDPTKEFSTKALVYNGHFLDYTKLLLLTRRGHIYTHPEGITKSTY